MLEKPGTSFCCLVSEAHGLFIVIHKAFLYITKAWNCGRANSSTDLSPLWNREIGIGLRCWDGACPLTDVAKVMSKNAPDFLRGSVDRNVIRSEEHTSELQSHSDLVCRLLLE